MKKKEKQVEEPVRKNYTITLTNGYGYGQQTIMAGKFTEDEIKTTIREAIADIDTPTMKNMKDVMTFVKGKYPTVNGGVVSKLFKEMIS